MFILHLSHSLSAKPRACQANCGLFIEKKNRDLFLSHEAALCCDDTHISISCPLRAPKKHIHASTSRSICQTFHHCQTILSSPCGTWGVSPFGVDEKKLGGSEGFQMLSPSISAKQGGITTIGAYQATDLHSGEDANLIHGTANF